MPKDLLPFFPDVAQEIQDGFKYDPTPGLLIPGNIDLTNRPKVKNPNGGESTVFTMTAGIEDGKVVLLPRIVNGKILEPEEAFNYFKQSGQHMGIFDNSEDADKYDEMIHQQMGWTGDKNKWK